MIQAVAEPVPVFVRPRRPTVRAPLRAGSSKPGHDSCRDEPAESTGRMRFHAGRILRDRGRPSGMRQDTISFPAALARASRGNPEVEFANQRVREACATDRGPSSLAPVDSPRHQLQQARRTLARDRRGGDFGQPLVARGRAGHVGCRLGNAGHPRRGGQLSRGRRRLPTADRRPRGGRTSKRRDGRYQRHPSVGGDRLSRFVAGVSTAGHCGRHAPARGATGRTDSGVRPHGPRLAGRRRSRRRNWPRVATPWRRPTSKPRWRRPGWSSC